MNKTDILLQAGFSMTEIQDACSVEASKLMNAGFTANEINDSVNKRYGLSIVQSLTTGDEALMCASSVLDNAMQLQGVKQKSEEPRKGAPTIFDGDIEQLAPKLKESLEQGYESFNQAKDEAGDALLMGYQHSNLGLWARGRLPDGSLPVDSNLLEKTFFALGQAAGDLPTYVAGGATGALTGNPLAVGAASFGMTEGTRKYLMLRYKNGEATNAKEAWAMTSEVLHAAGKGALTGAMSVGAGLLFAKGATAIVNSSATNAMAAALKARPQAAVIGAGVVGEELGATITGSLLEGRIPTYEDFILSAMSLAAFHGAKYYAKGSAKAVMEIIPGLSDTYRERLMRLYEITGKTPEEILNTTLIDPKSRLNMYSLNYQPASQVFMQNIKNANNPNGQYLKGTRLFTTAEAVDRGSKKTVQVLGAQTRAQTDKYKAQEAERTNAEIEGREPQLVNEFILPDNAVVVNADYKFINKAFKDFIKTGAGEEYFIKEYSPEIFERVKSDAKYRNVIAKEMFEEPAPEFLDFISKNEDLAYMSGLIGEDPLATKNKLVFGTPEYQAAANTRSKQFWDKYQETKGPAALKMEDGSYIILQPGKLKAAKDIPLEKPIFIKGKKVGSKDIDLDTAKADIEKYVNFEGKQPKTIKQRLTEFRQAWIDQFASLNTGADKGKMNISYFAALRTKYDGAIAEYIIKRGRIKFNTDEVVPGRTLQDILLSVPDKKDLSLYLVARKQLELYDRGAKENLLAVPLASARKVVQEFDAMPEYKQAALDLDGYMDYLREYSKDAGLITEKNLEKYRAENDVKAPVHTLPDFLVPILKHDEATTKTLFSALGVKDEKALQYKYYDDPISTSIALTYSVVSSALRNEALKITGKQFGMPIEKGNTDISYTKISFFDNGKYESRMVPQEIAKVCENISAQNAKLTGAFFGKSLLTKPARMANSGAVLFWDFLTKATFIDQVTAGLQSKNGYIPFVDMFKGFAASISHATNGKLFKDYAGVVDEWWRSGGYSAGIVAADRNSAKEVLRQLTKPSAVNVIKDPVKNYKDILHMLNMPSHFLNGLRGLSEQLDRATRLGEFMKAEKSGLSPREAAMASRDVTVDYKRMGAVGQAVNQYVAFFNAYAQGTDKFVRAFRDDSAVTTAVRTAAYLGVPAFLAALVRADIEVNDPDSEMAMVLKSIPTWQKTAYLMIPTGNSVLRIPKPYGFMMASSFIESFVEFAVNKEPGLLNSLYEGGFIESVERTFMPDLIPTAAKPLIEMKSNYSFFREGPVIPISAESVVPEEQFTMGTSETAKLLGRFFASVDSKMGLPLPDRMKSPIVIDNVIRSYTASLGTATVEFLDSQLRKAGIVKNVEPTKQLEDMPLFKTFMYKFGPQAKQISDFYKEEQELHKVYNTIKRLAQSPDPEARARGEALMARPYANLTFVLKASNNISKAIMGVYYNPDLSADEKASAINELYKNKVMVSTKGLELIKQIKEEF